MNSEVWKIGGTTASPRTASSWATMVKGAMSSRNELLSAEERKNAAVISETLFKAKELVTQNSVVELAEWIEKNINKSPFLTVEYVEIVDNEKLQPVKNWNEKNTKVACVAAYCGKVRLIDNIVLN